MKHTIEVVTDGMLLAMSGDLLYLYFNHGWQEPNTIILYLELVVLFSLPVFAIWRLWHYAFTCPIKKHGQH